MRDAPISHDTARRVIEAMLSRGGDFAEIFLESRIETALSFEAVGSDFELFTGGGGAPSILVGGLSVAGS